MSRTLLRMSPSFLSRPVVFHLLLMAGIAPLLIIRIYDVDVWWHVLYGKAFLENFAFPDMGRFYFTPTSDPTEYLRHNFLGDIVLYVFHRLGSDPGLQLAGVLAALSMVLLLRGCLGADRNAAPTLLLLTALVFASHQALMVRNAMFAAPFFSGVVFLFHRHLSSGRLAYVHAMWLAVSVWSLMHGTYLLGFVTCAFFFVGDAIDQWRRISPTGFRKNGTYALVLLAMYLVISVNGNMTERFVAKIFKVHQVSSTDVSEAPTVNKPEGFLAQVKFKLNNTMFKFAGKKYVSGDFSSPFDMLGYRPVVASLCFLVLGGLYFVFFSRPVRMAWLLPYLAIGVLGLGYLRTVGYIPMLTVGAILSGHDRGEARWDRLGIGGKTLQRASHVLVIAWIVFIWTMTAAGRLVPVVGLAAHTFGIGRMPWYDRVMNEHVLANHKGENAFNMIENGGYCLFSWYPEKRVFIDGLFPAHSLTTFGDYHQVLDARDFQEVMDRHDITLAILPHNKYQMREKFFLQPGWMPVCITNGSVLFRRKDPGRDGGRFQALIDAKALDLNNVYAERYFAQGFYQYLAWLLNNGHVHAARQIVADNRMAYVWSRERLPDLFHRLDGHVGMEGRS